MEYKFLALLEDDWSHSKLESKWYCLLAALNTGHKQNLQKGSRWNIEVRGAALSNHQSACRKKPCMYSEGYGIWFVRLSVHLSVHLSVTCDHAQRDNKTATSSLQWLHFQKGDFRTTITIVAWKASEQANMQMHWLTSTGSTCSVYLEGTISHNERRVSTPACYLLL